MAFTDDQISRIAYRQALTTEPSLPSDDINIGLLLIPSVRSLMEDRLTYLTATDAPGVADLALIEYIRLFLLGLQPETDVRFTTMKQRWTEAAARLRHKEADIDDCYDDPSFNKLRRRIRNLISRKNTCPD